MAFLAIQGDKVGFLFQFKDGRNLTKDRFITNVRDLLQKPGVDAKKYAGHSFRIGAATTASQCAIGEAMIKMLGRWESSGYFLYTKTPRDHLGGISALMCN